MTSCGKLKTPIPESIRYGGFHETPQKGGGISVEGDLVRRVWVCDIIAIAAFIAAEVEMVQGSEEADI